MNRPHRPGYFRGRPRRKKSDLTTLDIARGLLAQLEKEEEAKGDELMQQYGFRSIHFSQARASMQTLGIPDRKYYHVERKVTLWWEAKAEDGEQSKAQRDYQAMAEACGEIYVLGTHLDLAEWLAGYIRKKPALDAILSA